MAIDDQRLVQGMRVSRRALLLGGATASGALLLTGIGGLPVGTTPQAWAADEFDQLRLRLRSMLLGGPIDPADPRLVAAVADVGVRADAAMALLAPAADRTSVFTDVPLTASPAVTTTYRRLNDMAVSYATGGTAHHEDAQVLAEVVAGLRLMNDRIYRAGNPEFGNWWDWEVGGPRALMHTCALIYDHLPAQDLSDYVAAVDHYLPDPVYIRHGTPDQAVSTGYNRANVCGIVAIRGVLGKSSARIAAARDGLSDVFAFVSVGDGFYRDGSYIHHQTVAYTGGYGVGLLDASATLFELLADSTWAITDPRSQNLLDSIDRSFAPILFDNQVMDFVRGRNISRESESAHDAGHKAVDGILRMAASVDATSPTTAARWRGMCKGWLERDTFDDPFVGAPVTRAALFAQLLDDAAVVPAAEPSRFAVFPAMDRAVHRRPGWAYAISMASTRIAHYEAGNGENTTGYHSGSGMTNLYDADNGQYSDGFWVAVDRYRLPGTTVDSQPIPPSAGIGWGKAVSPSATWVGGCSLDDSYGAVGMHLQGFNSTMEARKSWFCLPDRIVALGAGITGGAAAVETIVENRNLHSGGQQVLTLDGEPQPSSGGWATDSTVTWAHLEDVGGYIFPDGVELKTLREDRSGSWADIDPLGSTDILTRRFLTMWIDHGVQPAAASYSYMLIPGIDAATTEQIAAHGAGDVQIVANSPTVQAVKVESERIAAINFWPPEFAERFTPVADNVVRDGSYAGTSFGSRNPLEVKLSPAPDSGYTRESYVRFDLSASSLGAADISRVRLSLHGRTTEIDATYSVQVYAVGADWGETTLTWSSRPSLGIHLGQIELTPEWQWHDLDVTTHALSRLGSDGQLRLALVRDPASGGSTAFAQISSREDAVHGPSVTIEPMFTPATTLGITADQPCSIVTKRDVDGGLTVAVADPQQTVGQIHLTLDRSGFSSWSGDPTVEVLSLNNPVQLVVNTAGSRGASHQVVLTRGRRVRPRRSPA